jgi:hypothetical protein
LAYRFVSPLKRAAKKKKKKKKKKMAPLAPGLKPWPIPRPWRVKGP